MWTRLYFLLLLIRCYFALSPSYIHPDENFQGPEVIAGESLIRILPLPSPLLLLLLLRLLLLLLLLLSLLLPASL